MQSLIYQALESQGTEPWALPYAELRFKTNGRVPEEILGIGGFGQVFLADFKGKQVAVKEPLNPTLLTSNQKLHEVTLLLTLTRCLVRVGPGRLGPRRWGTGSTSRWNASTTFRPRSSCAPPHAPIFHSHVHVFQYVHES